MAKKANSLAYTKWMCKYHIVFTWTTREGKRHSCTAATLEELREKEEKIIKDKQDGIRAEAKNVTVNDIYNLWREMKRGLKDNTFQNYCYMYEQFVLEELGKLRIQTLKKSDIKRFYNLLVDDGYLRTNVSDNVLKELKQALDRFLCLIL